MVTESLVYRLQKRAEIRKQITTRKSVQKNQPDRISDLLEEAAKEIERLQHFEQTVKFIAQDYCELSHDKVLWQRNDFKKRCQNTLEEYYAR